MARFETSFFAQSKKFYLGVGFGVWGLGFGVWGLGFGVVLWLGTLDNVRERRLVCVRGEPVVNEHIGSVGDRG